MLLLGGAVRGLAASAWDRNGLSGDSTVSRAWLDEALDRSDSEEEEPCTSARADSEDQGMTAETT